jgi:hypothetical protein
MTDAPVQTYRIDWNGIRIEVRYCPSWSESYERIYGYPLAHLEIEAIEPENAPLPVTNTGYRSHFTRPDLIDAEGGPVAFARSWLDEAAKDPAWIAAQDAARQMTLF